MAGHTAFFSQPNGHRVAARSLAGRRRGGSLSKGLVLSLAMVLAGCSCDEQPAPAASASASVAPPAPEAVVARKIEVVSFAAADKVPLKADALSSDSKTAPLLVLVHRFRGDRSEWTPLLKLLASAPKQYRVVSPDLRGHGESKSAAGAVVLDWGAMTKDEIPQLERDIEAAIQFGSAGLEPSHVVLVGSSLGATLAARVAARTPKLGAIAMLSPGGRLEGQDVFTAFAEVRTLPSYLAWGKSDNVSLAPIGSLIKMAKRGTVKEYDSRLHSAQHLGAETPAFWTDLEEWLMKSYELPAEAAPDAPLVDGAAPAADGGA